MKLMELKYTGPAIYISFGAVLTTYIASALRRVKDLMTPEAKYEMIKSGENLVSSDVLSNSAGVAAICATIISGVFLVDLYQNRKNAKKKQKQKELEEKAQ